MMGLFENPYSNTPKLDFNMSRTSKTPHMRVPNTIPPTTRLSKSYSKYSSTYQGTYVGYTSIYIPIAI